LLRREVRNLHAEEDVDHEGVERMTPPGTLGVVVEVEPASDTPVDVLFATGAWIRLTRAEINDPECYSLGRALTAGELEEWRNGLP
jgi:hypothetical protein